MQKRNMTVSRAALGFGRITIPCSLSYVRSTQRMSAMFLLSWSRPRVSPMPGVSMSRTRVLPMSTV